MNTEQFIQKAKEIHGDKYDYSKSEYKNCKTKIIIICKIHGVFSQLMDTHINRKGCCKKCADILRGNNRRFTREEIIQKSIEIHNDTYNYSNIDYINGEIKNIVCKIHGVFSQLRDIHINRKGGCKKCADILRGENRKFNNNDFIEKLKLLHGDKYDYSKVIYSGIYEKILIICKEHGEFEQISNNHLRGAGCQLCYDDRRGESIRNDTQQFIERAIKIHGEKYNYSKSNYISMDDKITIICKIHGEFSQVAYSHITGQGCKKCGIIQRANSRKSNTVDFIEKAIKIHGDRYDYSKSNYIKSNTKIIIICKTHGEFLQQPNNHINPGYGCVLCQNKTEGKLNQILILKYPSLITQFKQDWCKSIRNLPFDFCIPEYKIIIELDGRQHFQQVRNWSNPEEQQYNDKFKEKCANDNGYSVIRLLQEDVYNDTYDWFHELSEKIQLILNSNSIQNIYLCKNNEYTNYVNTNQ